MDEQTNIGFIVRARILPHIEGSDELKQSVENLATNIQQRMQQTTSSPAFTEGMKPEEQRKVEQFTSMKGIEEVQKFQERQREVLEQLDEEAGAGALSGKQRRGYQKEFQRQKKDIQQIQERLIERLDEPEFEFLPPEKKEVLRTSIMEGAQESFGQLDELNEKLQTVFDNLEKVRRSMRVPGRLEGAEELKRSIDEINEGIEGRLQRAVSSKKFREGLDPETIERAEQFTEIDRGRELGELRRQLVSQVEDEFGDLSEEKKEILIRAVTEGIDDALDEINQLRERAEDFSKFGQTPMKLSVLPDIEGAEALKRSLEGLSGNVRERVQQTISSQAFVEGMDEKDIRKMEHFAGMEDMAEVQKFQERQKEILEELDIDASAGRLTAAQRKKYIKKFGRQRQELEGLQENLLSQFDEGYFDFLEPEKKQILRTAIIEGTNEAIDQVDDLARQFETVADNIEKAQTNAKGFLENLKEIGAVALASTIANMALTYETRTAGIEAKERTSFSFGSPLQMYAARQQYEVYKTTEERLRDYELYGGLAGAGAGALGGAFLGAKVGAAGGPIGMGAGIIAGAIGGMMFGSSQATKYANIENIKDRAEVEEELSFLNQSWAQLSNYVGQAQQFDILRTRTRARLKENFEDVGFGYTPEQLAQFQMQFGDTFGKYDRGLYSEQLAFARAEGIDPQDIFRLNTTARMTDMDVGMLGLDEGSTLAKTIYGEKISGQRIVDVLTEIKEINERMLKLNVDMDTRDALGMSRVPDMLFGIDNPYGRLGELGGQTIRQLEGLMQPKSMAHESFLYTSLETPNIMEFTELMKGGIYESDNLLKILKSVRDTTQGEESLSYFMLNEMMPDAPRGLIPRMTGLLSEEGKEITRYKIEDVDEQGKIKYATDEGGKRIKETISGYTLDDFEKEMDAYNDRISKLTLTAREEQEVREEINNALTGYSQRADDAISQSERMLRTLHQNINEAAESWRGMVYNADIEMTKFWQRQAEEAEMFELFQVKINKGMEDFETIIKRIKSDLGLGKEPIPKEISTARPASPNPFIGSDPNPEDLRKMTQQEWESFQENINKGTKMIHSESYQNYFKDFDYERFEDIMDRTFKNRPQEIIVTIKDETSRGIESTTENANADFR